MFFVSKLPTLANVLAILFLIAGIVIIAVVIYLESAGDLWLKPEIDHTFFLGLGCLIASFLIAPPPKRHR